MFFSDLTHQMIEIANHWRSIGTDFDAIYSGFLGSAEQIEMLAGFIRDFSKKNDGSPTLIAIDPVMGDDGELYSTYNNELMIGMSRLCYGADLITPNLTEACFLTGEKYPCHTLSENEGKEMAKHLLKKLSEKFGCKKVVVSGISYEDGEGKSVPTAALDEKKAMPHFHSTALMSRAYPGTGDLFASVLLGKLLSGEDFETSLDYACDFTAYTIAFSEGYATPIRDGLIIEPCLSKLM
jgi:pyridoxine kinase